MLNPVRSSTLQQTLPSSTSHYRDSSKFDGQLYCKEVLLFRGVCHNDESVTCRNRSYRHLAMPDWHFPLQRGDGETASPAAGNRTRFAISALCVLLFTGDTPGFPTTSAYV